MLLSFNPLTRVHIVSKFLPQQLAIHIEKQQLSYHNFKLNKTLRVLTMRTFKSCLLPWKRTHMFVSRGILFVSGLVHSSRHRFNVKVLHHWLCSSMKTNIHAIYNIFQSVWPRISRFSAHSVVTRWRSSVI